jgi:hypothetical protein
MSTIIAAVFEAMEPATQATDALVTEHFQRPDLSVFHLNPPGRHGKTPIGGDHVLADPEARHAHSRSLTGVAIGGLLGLVAGIILSYRFDAGLISVMVVAAATGVGAYAGSLLGGLSGTGGKYATQRSAERGSGVMVAVRADDALKERTAINCLARYGGKDVERAFGTWRDGQWIDFDPVSRPVLVREARQS